MFSQQTRPGQGTGLGLSGGSGFGGPQGALIKQQQQQQQQQQFSQVELIIEFHLS